MKKLLIVFLPLLVAGCSPHDRYEIVKTEKEIIRLDKDTGGMVVVDPKEGTAGEISVLKSSELCGSDPILSKVKFLSNFILPESKKRVVIAVECRWMDGRMDYRVTANPFISELVLFNNASKEKDAFQINFDDSDGFPVETIDPLFWLGHRITDEKTRLSEVVVQSWIRMTKSEYQRIVNASPSWKYSEEMKASLGQ